MPFPGNDPLPQEAVKRLNKMKKYFLERIGSMDIMQGEREEREDERKEGSKEEMKQGEHKKERRRKDG